LKQILDRLTGDEVWLNEHIDQVRELPDGKLSIESQQSLHDHSKLEMQLAAFKVSLASLRERTAEFIDPDSGLKKQVMKKNTWLKS